MSMLGQGVVGARVLDLYAGSGALGLEALSRGAREVVFVERSRPVLRTLERNLETLEPDDDEVRVVRWDVVRFLDGLEGEAFDVALADPPYEKGLASALLERFHANPFAREIWVEHASDEPLPEIPGLRSRRYGDTTLTRLDAQDPDRRSHR